MGSDIERTHLVARCRKNAKLCFKASTGGRAFYAKEKFTPEQVRQDESIPCKETTIFHGGDWRKIRYKEVNYVYWQNGTKRKPLRLIVIAPTPYKLTKKGSSILLASIISFKDSYTDDFNILPRWRKKKKRPSCLDLIHLLRKQLIRNPKLTLEWGIDINLLDTLAKSAA